MNNKLKTLVVSAGLIATMAACIADEPLYSEGEGTIFLSTRLNSDVQVRSRSELDDLAQSCDIWIANEKGIVRKYSGQDEIPAEGIRLVAGNYKAMIWAGDSVPASWNSRFFKGETDFTIANGDNRIIPVVGRIANSAVAVTFDETVDGVLSDYSMTVGHSQGKLVYDKTTEEGKIGYFMMNSRDKSLAYTLKGKLNDGSDYVRTDTIRNCKPTTLYTLKVVCTEDNTEIGGAYLTIEIVEDVIDMPVEITIDAAPEVKGIGFDIAQTQRAKEGNMGGRSVWITATSEITSLVLTCDYFDTLFGFGGGNDFDFFQMTDTGLKSQIENAGITYVYSENVQEDESLLPTIKLNFTADFTDKLPEGKYPVRIDVTDVKGKFGSATLTLEISDAPITTIAADLNNVWTDRAIVSLSVNKEIESPVFKYRVKGSQQWTGEAQPSLVADHSYASGDVLTAELTGLQPSTTYEFCACDGDFEGNVEEFTTEVAAQLPNNSFENWQTNSSPYLIYEAGGAMFWDSGNHGSSTLRKNVTVPTTSMKKSGDRAISLESQFVGLFGQGKFAAGNVFIGKYLATDGTDGVLGWGRPFNSRPKQLKVWAHYTPVNINYRDDDAPAEYVKGQPDKGTIYIALLDNHTENYNGENYPVIIRTKKASRSLFDPYGKDKSHVIGYGIYDFTQATSANELVEITVDIDYDTFGNNIRPTYILLTASASKGGDYFTGGDGSKLVLDDIELVY